MDAMPAPVTTVAHDFNEHSHCRNCGLTQEKVVKDGVACVHARPLAKYGEKTPIFFPKKKKDKTDGPARLP